MKINEIRSISEDVELIQIDEIKEDILLKKQNEMVEKKREMMECEERRIMMEDKKKLERREMKNLGEIRDLDVVIVDEKKNLENIERMKEKGINVVVEREQEKVDVIKERRR